MTVRQGRARPSVGVSVMQIVIGLSQLAFGLLNLRDPDQGTGRHIPPVMQIVLGVALMGVGTTRVVISIVTSRTARRGDKN